MWEKRKARLTGSKQFNLGMVHSMKDDLPFCYRTHPGSIADITTLHNMVSDPKAMGCKVSEIVLDRGFFSAGNIAMLAERKMGFTVPIPVRSRYFST
jgi:transposase